MRVVNGTSFVYYGGFTQMEEYGSYGFIYTRTTKSD